MHPVYEKANKALEDATIAMQTILDTFLICQILVLSPILMHEDSIFR